MKEIFEFLSTLQSSAGTWAVFGFLLLIAIITVALMGVMLFWKLSGKTIENVLDKREQSAKDVHKEGTKLRKNFSDQSRAILQELAETCNADRALIFEYSNGSTNLIGMPFLYASVTVEVTRPKVPPVAMQYQKMNLSLFTNFINKLDEHGFIYIEDIHSLKDEEPIIHTLMTRNAAKSALFYNLQGIDESVGFIVVSTVDENKLCKENTLGELTKVAQKVSSMWNLANMN